MIISNAINRGSSLAGAKLPSKARYFAKHNKSLATQNIETIAINNVNLMTLQELDVDEQEFQECYELCDNILNSLKEIKIAMLSGKLTIAHYNYLQKIVHNHNSVFHNPLIKQLFNDVLLRATVELAKAGLIGDDIL